jgi:ankyrin repeat protein
MTPTDRSLKRVMPNQALADTHPSIHKKQSRADILFVTGPGENLADHEILDCIVKKSRLANIVFGDGIQDLDTDALKKEIQQRLKPNGHVLLAGHGGINQGQHFFYIKEQGTAIPTRDILKLSEHGELQKQKETGITWHALTCHGRNLHKEIEPGSEEWKRGYVFIYSSSKAVITASMSDSLEAMTRYLADCKEKFIEADPLSLFIHLTKTQGDCITLLGGDLHAPLVSHAPKTIHDQTGTGRTNRIKGDDRDLHLLQERKKMMGIASEPNYQEKRNQLLSMLHARVDRNDLDAVTNILHSHSYLISEKDNDGSTFLWISCFQGFKKMAELFLKMGANINEGDNKKETPLMIAVFMEHRNIATLLLQNGADITLQNTEKEHALIMAIHTGNKKTVALLLNHGADKIINVGDQDGNTALMLAAEAGMASIVRLLLEAGADTSIRNKAGKTALHQVNQLAFPETTELLMRFRKQQDASRKNKEVQRAPFDF